MGEITQDKKQNEFKMPGQNNKTYIIKKHQKIPRAVSAASIENAALYYMERYATSSENLRQILERKIMRAASYHDTNIEACTQLVDNLIQRYLENGILNDETYASTQAANMNRRGKSLRAIRFRLRKKALPIEIIDKAVKALTNEIGFPDLIAAIAYAKKRQLGPYRRKTCTPADINKELRALARSGFSYSLALRIVESRNISELENDL